MRIIRVAWEAIKALTLLAVLVMVFPEFMYLVYRMWVIVFWIGILTTILGYWPTPFDKKRQ